MSNMAYSISKRLSNNPPTQVRIALEQALLACLDKRKVDAVEYYRKADRLEMLSIAHTQPNRWLAGTEDITLLDERGRSL